MVEVIDALNKEHERKLDAARFWHKREARELCERIAKLGGELERIALRRAERLRDGQRYRLRGRCYQVTVVAYLPHLDLVPHPVHSHFPSTLECRLHVAADGCLLAPGQPLTTTHEDHRGFGTIDEMELIEEPERREP